MCGALDRNFAKGDIFSYIKPTGGMFVWLNMNTNNENVRNKPWVDSSEELFKKLAADGLIVVPGGDFKVNVPWENKPNHDLNIRLTFAAANKDKINEGIQRLKDSLSK